MQSALTRMMALLILATGSWACGEDLVAPEDTSIVGTWFFIGFTDGTRVATTSGTWVFFDDGLMAVDVTITFPGQNTNPLGRVGSYEVVGDTLTYELSGPLSSWTIAFDGPEVLLTQTSPPPADNTIRLRRVRAGLGVVSTTGPGE
jgi:hypothetical protein